MTIHASKLSTSKKYNKEVFCIMFAAKSVPAYRIRQQFRSGAKSMQSPPLKRHENKSSK